MRSRQLVLVLLPLLRHCGAVLEYHERVCYDWTSKEKQTLENLNSICFWGHCEGSCKDCFSECVDGQGESWMRASNDTVSYGVALADVDTHWGRPRQCTLGQECDVTTQPADILQNELFPPLQPVNAAGAGANHWIRYCKCYDGFIGPSCEIEESPTIPFVYTLIGLIATTAMSFYVLGMDHLTNFRDPERIMLDSHAEENNSSWNWTAANIMFQYYLMGAGAFCYSIAWSDDFFLIKIMRAFTEFFLDFFNILTEFILPSDWTTTDAQMIKICFAVMAPTLIILTATTSQKTLTHGQIKLRRAKGIKTGKAGDKMYTHIGAVMVYQILPLLTIPVAGTLFRPIAGCHMNAVSLDPAAIRPEDEAQRTPSIEQTFMPVGQRNDCSFGNSTQTYFYIGAVLMLPFWALGLYLGGSAESGDLTFPVHTGFYVIHTQLMVMVAMAYRAFKLRHPMYLSSCLLIINLVSAVVVVVFRPNDHNSLNKVRIPAVALALICSGGAVLAQMIDDRSSNLSAIFLCLSLLAWVGGIVFLKMSSGGADGAGGDDDEDAEEGDSGKPDEVVVDGVVDEAVNPVNSDSD